jgi:hypothetical protein
MKKMIVPLLCVLLASFAAACSTGSAGPGAAAGSAPTSAVFTDPAAYCAAVGTIDKPDARYTGAPVPDAVINGFKKAAGLESSTEPMDMLRKTTIWRCMDGKGYACNFGANLQCDSKANTDRTASQALVDYCKANPDSQVVPMSVTGHDTIYSWQCVKDTPQIVQQIAQVDKAGYLQTIWYAIEVVP